MKLKRKTLAQVNKEIHAFNAANPIGTDVSVLRDDGFTMRTLTRSFASALNSGFAVIQVEGLEKSIYLDQVTVLKGVAK